MSSTRMGEQTPNIGSISPRTLQVFWGVLLIIVGCSLLLFCSILADAIQHAHAWLIRPELHEKGGPRELIWETGNFAHRMQWLEYRTFVFDYLFIALQLIGIGVCVSSASPRVQRTLFVVYFVFWSILAYCTVSAASLSPYSHPSIFALIPMAFFFTPWAPMAIGLLLETRARQP